MLEPYQCKTDNRVLDSSRHCYTAENRHGSKNNPWSLCDPCLIWLPWSRNLNGKNIVKNPDEPLFHDKDAKDGPGTTGTPTVRDRIRQLAGQQPYAVLCVQGEGQPYGALVAFAFSEDLRHAAFVTPVATRKYRLLSECDHVAMVIDNRPNKADELMEIEAVTVTGRSQMIERGPEFDKWAGLLVTRHPYLQSFVNAATCALFRVDVVRFLHVARFQEVSQWVPGEHS